MITYVSEAPLVSTFLKMEAADSSSAIIQKTTV
jgi:hypothetical protein